MFETQVVMHRRFLSGAYLECCRKSQGCEVVYCPDYDVLFAFLHPHVVGTRCTGAVRYLLENTNNRIAIPPGTFCWLLNLIEQSNRRSSEYREFGRRLKASPPLRTAVDAVLRLQRRTGGNSMVSPPTDLVRKDRELFDSIKPEMLSSVLASHRHLQSLVGVLQKDDRFIGALLSPGDFDARAVGSLAGEISHLGLFRTQKPMTNRLAAMNILSLCRARATENELYRARRRKGSAQPPICHMELITNTPSLFRLRLDEDHIQDEFREQEEPSPDFPQNTLMTTPWQALYRVICQRACSLPTASAKVNGAIDICDEVLSKLRRARGNEKLRRMFLCGHETDWEKVLLALKIEERFHEHVMEQVIKTYDRYVHEPILAEVDRILLEDTSIDRMKNGQHRLPSGSWELSLELLQASDKLRHSVLALKDLLSTPACFGSASDDKQLPDQVRMREMISQKWEEVDVPGEVDVACFQLTRDLSGNTKGTLLTVDIYDDRYAVHWETNHTIEDIRRSFDDLQSAHADIGLLFDVETEALGATAGHGASVVCSPDAHPREIYSAMRRGAEGIGWGRKSLGAFRPAVSSVTIPLRGALLMIETVSVAGLPREICVVSRSNLSQALAELYLHTSNAFAIKSVLVKRLDNLLKKRGFGATK